MKDNEYKIYNIGIRVCEKYIAQPPENNVWDQIWNRKMHSIEKL
jgi:hypothetical protein